MKIINTADTTINLHTYIFIKRIQQNIICSCFQAVFILQLYYIINYNPI